MRNKPTQADVAKLAGVSRATVSYVINNREEENAIPQETSERVWTAIAELGYVPNQQAQHLKRQATNRICVILPRLGIPAQDLMIQAQRKYLTKNGYSIIIAVGDTQERIMNLIQQVKGGLADGIYLDIGYGSNHNIDVILQQLKGMNIPIIVNAPTEPTSDYDVNWTTDKAGAHEAVTYLIECGHQRIAFIGHNIADLEHYGRYQGYMQALSEHNIPINPEYVRVGLERREQASRAVEELLDLDMPPTAIFCTSDINALTAVATIQHCGQTVPHNLAVIGFGNISESQYTYPRLTTVGPEEHNFDEVASLLLHRLTGKKQKPPQKIVREWKLIIRQST